MNKTQILDHLHKMAENEDVAAGKAAAEKKEIEANRHEGRAEGMRDAMLALQKLPTKDMRDEFAMAAMTGLISSDAEVTFSEEEQGMTIAELVASRAYKYADAMMKARG